jgi:transposase-like protein
MSKIRSRRRDPGRERHWQEVIRAHTSSGQSVREYCRQAGVKEASFYWWRRELARRSPTEKRARPRSRAGSSREAGPASAGPGRGRRAASKRTRKSGQGRSPSRPAAHGPRSPFLPVHVLTDTTAAGVEIHLGGGRMVCVRPGFDQQTLRDVLAALEGRSC